MSLDAVGSVTAVAASDDARVLRDGIRIVNATWERVLDGAPLIVRCVRIAGTDVQIVVAGDALAEVLLPAFERHPPATTTPRVTVGAWDAAATGFPLPARPDGGDGQGRRWIARRQGHAAAGLEWDFYGLLRASDRDARRHLLGVASASELSPWEAGAPFRRQLTWALGPDTLFVHAGAVGDRAGAALIMGSSGSGKSTTSLACLRAGMGFLGDDYCLVRYGEPPTVHLLHALARVDRRELPFLGDLARPAPWAGEPGGGSRIDKALLLLGRTVPDRLLMSAPVRVVLMPIPSGASSPRLVPVAPAEALRLLAPGALKQMAVDPKHELSVLANLLRTVPTYRLFLSEDRELNPRAVEHAIARAAAA